MKYKFLILAIFCFASITVLHQAESQTFFDKPQTFDVNSIIDSLVDPNSGLPVGVVEQVEIEQIPRIPLPGEIVNIRVISYLTDLNKAEIIWTQDGKVINSGTGATRLSVTAPASGQSANIQVRILKQGGGEILQTISLNPADVDLIYEANTYAHPFYKGKKLFTSESEIVFIALPNFIGRDGKKIEDSELVYTWKINGSVNQAISGYGRNRFITRGSLIERPTNITVEVSAINSSLIASKTVQMQTQKPELVLYENNPILGVIYEKAIQGSFVLERPEVDFEGIPYFFSADFKDDPDLVYKWSINGIRSEAKSSNDNYILLRNQKNEDGKALITVQLDHINNILQSTRTGLELNFKKVNNINNEEFVF